MNDTTTMKVQKTVGNLQQHTLLGRPIQFLPDNLELDQIGEEHLV